MRIILNAQLFSSSVALGWSACQLSVCRFVGSKSSCNGCMPGAIRSVCIVPYCCTLCRIAISFANNWTSFIINSWIVFFHPVLHPHPPTKTEKFPHQRGRTLTERVSKARSAPQFPRHAIFCSAGAICITSSGIRLGCAIPRHAIRIRAK